ncbi:MAG TPA: N-acetylneuraminate synthase family protein [Tepidisphaeraceae bacterium]|jgi:sialic acid synthase SpsE|nr:N-acetylneuraminate synthase family protein [Tepidisphaeraceae bacterium]
MKEIEIGRPPFSRDGRVMVIAEIGVNHDGCAKRAIELVHAAAECGADAVKLQVFRADRLMHELSAFAGYQKRSLLDASPIDMLRRFELEDPDLRQVVTEILAAEMVPLATPFSLEDVETVESLSLPVIKIASPDIVNWPLLRRAAKTGTPLLISTGAASLNEISSSVAWLRGWNATFALLHCISSYPTPADSANLCWITELAGRFDVPVGFSDHTTEVVSGALAVGAGAVILEKHLTYDRAAAGPDHAASLDPNDFANYVKLVRLAETMRGAGSKRVLDIERDVRSVSRQSLVAARDLHAGHVIRESDLIVQRPGTGIPASAWPSIIGQRTGQFIKAGQMLSWHLISDAA